MSGHLNRAEIGIVEIFLPEVSRTLPGIFAPRKAPLSIQTLEQGGFSLCQFFRIGKANMVGVGIQPVDPENGWVCEPI